MSIKTHAILTLIFMSFGSFYFPLFIEWYKGYIGGLPILFSIFIGMVTMLNIIWLLTRFIDEEFKNK